MSPLVRRFFCAASCLVASILVVPSSFAQEAKSYDVVIYGGTPAGVMAAVAAGRKGKSVLLLNESYLLGGMMTGGLTKTDVGNIETVGGLSREFYDRNLAYYTKTFGPDSKEVKQTYNGFFFEPRVAGLIFREMLDGAKVEVRLNERMQSAQVKDGRIESVTVRNTKTGQSDTFTGQVFIDSSYEGDLLAAAGVPYRVGREAREEYDEDLAGVNEGPEMYRGKGDHRLQAFNIRGTLSNKPDNRVAIPKPKNYNIKPHEYLVATVNKYGIKSFGELFTDIEKWALVNGKVDPNRADLPGANFNYIEGDAEERARVVEKVQDHWLSMWYMLQNDPRLSEEFRESAKEWGLPKDEYLESGHVTPQVYVREGRRMLGRYFLSQHDVDEERWKDDGICLGSYNFDSHIVQNFLTESGPTDEGHFIQITDDYEIPYRSITPYAPSNLLVTCAVSASHVAYSTLRMEPVFMMIGNAAGLAAQIAIDDKVSVQDVPVDQLRKELSDAKVPLVASFRPTVIISADKTKVDVGEPVKFSFKKVRVNAPLTKIAWNFDGSGRIDSTDEVVTQTFTEPGVYTVSLIAEDQDKLVSPISHKTIIVGDVSEDEEIILTATRPSFKGRWEKTRGSEPEYRKRVAFTDRKDGKGEKSATYSMTIPKTGRYLLAQAYSQSPNRANNVPVKVTYPGGEKTITVNQSKRKPAPFAFQPLDEFVFNEGDVVNVEISNTGTEGFVIADDVRFIWKGK